MEMEYRIAGIPCLIRLIDSDEFGIDWEVADRKGYVAYWLAKKLSDDEARQVTADFMAFLGRY